MGGNGCTGDPEETNETIEDLVEESLRRSGDLSRPVLDEGEISSEGEPDVEAVNSREQSNRVNQNHQGVLRDAELTESLEQDYRSLFEMGGFEVLEEVDQRKSTYEIAARYGREEDLISPLIDNGFVEFSEDEEGFQQIGFTEKSKQMYSNWSGFRDYLGSEERVSSIEEEEGEESAHRFIAATTPKIFQTERSLGEYLEGKKRVRRRWSEQYEQGDEFQQIITALCDENLGSLEELELVQRGEAPDNTTESLEEAGVRGLVNSEGLNPEGRRLYNKVLTDYTNRL